MPDNKAINGPEDKRRIDIHDPSEVKNWCAAFNCTEAELKRAIRAAENTYAKDVQHYI